MTYQKNIIIDEIGVEILLYGSTKVAKYFKILNKMDKSVSPTSLKYTWKPRNIPEYKSIYKFSKLDRYTNIILFKKHVTNNQDKKLAEFYRKLGTAIVDSKKYFEINEYNN